MKRDSLRIKRIQIGLKPGFRDVDGERIERDAHRYLGIETGRVRTTKCYIVESYLSDAEIKYFAENAIQDRILHTLSIDHIESDGEFRSYVLVGKLPGVTDDEGTSARTSLLDIFYPAVPESLDSRVYSENIIYFEKSLGDEELKKIAHELLGNPLINHFEWGPLPVKTAYYPKTSVSASFSVRTISLEIPDSALLELSEKMLLALNLEEMKAIQAYYRRPSVRDCRRSKGLPESPTDIELETIAQTWSEHCKHKEFNAEILFTDNETGETSLIDSLFRTYIKGATEKISRELDRYGNNWLVKVFNDNAGVVRIDSERLFVWKVETHNSPSAIDPYGGAITGILGNNRDPLCTGRGGAKLLFNTNVLCFASPFYDGPLLRGQLHPRRIMQGVIKGIEDGGNKSGIPTINGAVIFDDRYRGKPLVYCGTGGILPARFPSGNSWIKEIFPGDRIVMAGGRVGKDGIHGATFSSLQLDENSPSSAVQIGSPITQKKAYDFLVEASQKGLVRCSTDCGAGGLSSAIGELATLSNGARVFLEKVPLKYPGLCPWEIFLSESQERFILAVDPADIDSLQKIAARHEVELSIIGEFDSTGRLEAFYENTPVLSLELDFLHNGVPRKKLVAEWPPPELLIKNKFSSSNSNSPVMSGITSSKTIKKYDGPLLELMGSLNICSRERIIRVYDHEVKGRTILKPLHGTSRISSPQDAAVVRLDFDGYTGIAVSCGIMPKYGDIDPYNMSAGAFDEAVRQIISTGGKLPDPADSTNRFWSVNDNFCMPDCVHDPVSNPDGKFKLGKLVLMCRALYDCATFFNIPMTSGKDSMKNDFRSGNVKISVPPTVLYSMAAKIDDIRKIVTAEFKSQGDLIYIVGRTYNELLFSEYSSLTSRTGGRVPAVRLKDAKRIYEKMMLATDEKLLESSHDLSDGGLAVALAECTFTSLSPEPYLSQSSDSAGAGNSPDFPVSFAGAIINLTEKLLSEEEDEEPSQYLECSGISWIEKVLFSESHSRFIVSVRRENRSRFEELMGEDAIYMGEVTSDGRLVIIADEHRVVDLEVSKLYRKWTGTFEEL